VYFFFAFSHWPFLRVACWCFKLVKPSFCWNHADETPRRTHVEPGTPGKPQFDATCWRHAEIARIRQMFAEQTFVSAEQTFLLFSLSNAIAFRDIWFSNLFKFTSTLSIASHLTNQRATNSMTSASKTCLLAFTKVIAVDCCMRIDHSIQPLVYILILLTLFSKVATIVVDCRFRDLNLWTDNRWHFEHARVSRAIFKHVQTVPCLQLCLQFCILIVQCLLLSPPVCSACRWSLNKFSSV
jgi:hypothetical protein